MQIKFHNDTYFHLKPSTMQAKTSNKPSMHIYDLVFQPHDTKITTVNELQNHTDTTPHAISTTAIIEMTSNPNSPTLYQRISNSTNKLFFILYTQANTLARQWYLVQVDIEYTMHLNDKYHNKNVYFLVFLAKYPSDVRKSDDFSQWWPDWYEYTTCPDTGHNIYGDRVLFAPSRLPNQDKYIQWAT